MRLQRNGSARKWARAALKCGLLLTDTKLWTSIGEQLQERAADVSDQVHRRYEDTTSRLHEAHAALRGRSHWLTHTASLIGGIGIGVGLGMLFAPGSGEETRSVLHKRVVDIGNRVGDIANEAGIRSGAINSASGTGGD